MGGRSSSSGFRISAFYQNRLNQIDAQIRREFITASLIASDSPTVRRKAQAARNRIERLRQQYDQIERIAMQDARGGIGFWRREGRQEP